MRRFDVSAWYRDALLAHGAQVIGEAQAAMAASAFRELPLVVRLPGVHWRAGVDRRAELAAGLISTSDATRWGDDEFGHGYEPVVAQLAKLRAASPQPPLELDYTCLEMGNDEGGAQVASRAEDLVFWIGAAAARHALPVGGENALSGGIYSDAGWWHMRNVLQWSHYRTLTLLRLHDAVRSPVARREITALTQPWLR